MGGVLALEGHVVARAPALGIARRSDALAPPYIISAPSEVRGQRGAQTELGGGARVKQNCRRADVGAWPLEGEGACRICAQRREGAGIGN